MKRIVGVNERGLRVGEDHPLAKLTNAEVDRLLVLREEGMSYGRLATAFEISKSAVRFYCKAQRRCQTPVRYKEVHVSDKAQG